MFGLLEVRKNFYDDNIRGVFLDYWAERDPFYWDVITRKAQYGFRSSIAYSRASAGILIERYFPVQCKGTREQVNSMLRKLKVPFVCRPGVPAVNYTNWWPNTHQGLISPHQWRIAKTNDLIIKHDTILGIEGCYIPMELVYEDSSEWRRRR